MPGLHAFNAEEAFIGTTAQPDRCCVRPPAHLPTTPPLSADFPPIFLERLDARARRRGDVLRFA